MSSGSASRGAAPAFRDQTLALLRACELRREGSTIGFRWFGDDVGEYDAGGGQGGGLALTAQLASTIYSYAYVSGGPIRMPADREAVRARTPRFTGFVDAIAAEVVPSSAWEAGWRVARVDGASLIVEADGLRARVRAADCRAADGRGVVEAGAGVMVRRSTTFRRRSPGYFAFAGENLTGGLGGGRALARIYWHLRPSGAALFARAVTASFANQGLPFWAKVLAAPDEYARCDAGVLYLRRADLDAARSCVREVHAAVAPRLRVRVPLWTLPLAPGVAYAEDPGGDESFGMLRARLMAEAIAADPEAAEETHLAGFASRLAAAGGTAERPYLCGADPEPGAVERVEALASELAA